MARTVKRKTTGPDISTLRKIRDEFLKAKELSKAIEAQTLAWRAKLVGALEEHGYEDESGNKWIDLDDEGTRLKYERRVSVNLDVAEATAWAKANDHWDDVKVVVEQLDEDRLAALAWDDTTIEKTVKRFYKEKEIWALRA